MCGTGTGKWEWNKRQMKRRVGDGISRPMSWDIGIIHSLSNKKRTTNSRMNIPKCWRNKIQRNDR